MQKPDFLKPKDKVEGAMIATLSLDFLKPKDKVAIIAPSGRVFEKELQENLDFLHSLDLEIVQGKHLYKTHYDAYHYAGTIQERLKDFQWALEIGRAHV